MYTEVNITYGFAVVVVNSVFTVVYVKRLCLVTNNHGSVKT